MIFIVGILICAIVFLIVRLCIILNKIRVLARDKDNIQQNYQDYISQTRNELRQIEVEHQNKINQINSENNLTISSLNRLHAEEIAEHNTKYKKLLSAKKSQETRTGQILEKVAPLLDSFDIDFLSDTCVPLFSISDYLVVTPSGVNFVEVKSGNAKLSDRQKRLKRNIEEGRVYFKVFREKGND